MKWLKRGIVILLIVSIPIALYIIFSPRHIVREFVVRLCSGELDIMSVDITVQRRPTLLRTRSISYTVTGSITIGDAKFIRAFDDPHMGRVVRRTPHRWYTFTFLPYGIDQSGMRCFDCIACCSTCILTVNPDSIRFNHVGGVVFLGHCEYSRELFGGRIMANVYQAID